MTKECSWFDLGGGLYLANNWAKPWKRAWKATARLQGRCEREQEWRRFKLNALASTHGNFVNYGASLTIAWQGWPSDPGDRQTAGCMLASDMCLAWPLLHIAGIPLLAHSLTVKLSLCPCSHSSPAGRMATCLWAFQMQFATRSGLPHGDSASF